MTECRFQFRELDILRDKLGESTIELDGGCKLYYALPRDCREPYARRWFFNQLIYCRIAQEIGTKVLQVELCRHGEQHFLCNELLQCERLNVAAYQGKQTRSRVSLNGYNLTAFYNCLKPALFRSVTEQFADLFITDQLLRMLDRTPDNMFGVFDSTGNCLEIIAIDHEHCLALGGDERPQPIPAHVQANCHPTQMSYLLENFTIELLLAKVQMVRKKASPQFVRDIAHDLAKRLNSFLPEYDASVLESHAMLTSDLFDKLWQHLPEKVKDFHKVYSVCLRNHGLIP